MRDFDDLYQSEHGRANWFDSLTAPAQQWLKDLAVFIEAKGQPPVWATVNKRFGELFPGEAPKSPGTIRDTMRRLSTSG